MPSKLPQNCYLRGDTIWGRLTVDGREHRRSLRTSDPREAKVRLAAWRKKVERQAFDIEGGHSFREAVIRWSKEVLPEAVKPSVARRYLTSVVALDPVFGKLPVEGISAKDIARYVSTRSGEVANATIRRDLTALSRLLAACCSWGWISQNPAAMYDRSIVREQAKQMSIPSDADFETVLSFVPAGARLILRLLDQTGMRSAEAVTLEWTEVDIARRQILLRTTKSGRPRALKWRTPAGDAGLVLLDLKPATKFVFPSSDDVSYHSFSSVFGNAMRRLLEREAKEGRPFRRFRVHDLRHRFAVRWLKAGGDIYRLSRHLGHTSVSTTEIYLRYLTEDEIDVIRGLSSSAAQSTAQSPNTVEEANQEGA
jgi:integrase